MPELAGIDLYDGARTTRAVRRLRPDPIPSQTLRRVFSAAGWAPSGSNQQPWRIIAVEDPARKQKLAQLWIDNVGVERRNGTQPAPAAHVIRHRPLEVLAQLGVRDAICAEVPSLLLKNINWCATLGGSEVGRLDLRAGRAGTDDPLNEAWINLSQSLLEPILADVVESSPPSQLIFGAECVGVEPGTHGAAAFIILLRVHGRFDRRRGRGEQDSQATSKSAWR
jgi:nitroreductase